MSNEIDAARQHIYQKALALLARREHSVVELRSKLERFSGAEEVLDEVLQTLQEQGYQSDLRYAEMAVRSQFGRGHGPLRIKQSLQQKGIARDLMAQVFEQAAVDWHSAARQAREKRFGDWLAQGDYKERARQMRFLAGRGFAAEHIESAFESNESLD